METGLFRNGYIWIILYAFMDVLHFSFVYVECLVLLDIYLLVIGFVSHAFFINLFQKGENKLPHLLLRISIL